MCAVFLDDGVQVLDVACKNKMQFFISCLVYLPGWFDIIWFDIHKFASENLLQLWCNSCSPFSLPVKLHYRYKYCAKSISRDNIKSNYHYLCKANRLINCLALHCGISRASAMELPQAKPLIQRVKNFILTHQFGQEIRSDSRCGSQTAGTDRCGRGEACCPRQPSPPPTGWPSTRGRQSTWAPPTER